MINRETCLSLIKHLITMNVYGIQIPDKPLTNFDILRYVKDLEISDFRGVFMRDNLPKAPYDRECGIVNFNTLSEPGSHWVSYYKNGENRIYFDSFGQITLHEVQKYLKKENETDKQVILRNTDIVQPPGTSICGHLCLYVLKSLSDGTSFRDTLNSLTTEGSGIKWSNPLADELHKPVRKNFPKRYVFVRNTDDVWGADLVDMQALAKDNDSYRYILMVIDVFSKYGWAIPIKFKNGEEVKAALQSLLTKETTPQKIWADHGNEFWNVKVRRLLKHHSIELYSTENEEKCSVIERWNRTIKTQLWKYFTANGTHRYIDILQPLIDKYNSTKHRSIGFTPSDARKPANHQQVFKNLYFKKVQQSLKKPKFKIGDKVRLAVQKDRFEKAYIINWSDRVYTIKDVKKTLPPTYTVQDERGKQHKGTFYEQELQENKDDRYRIEKVLKYKTEKGRRYGLVKWIGYDDSYNSWEPVNELKPM